MSWIRLLLLLLLSLESLARPAGQLFTNPAIGVRYRGPADSLLVTKNTFLEDLRDNFNTLAALGIPKNEARLFIPPYEWYNDSIVAWSRQAGLTLLNYTPGALSHADYTAPEMKNYRSSEEICRNILNYRIVLVL